MSFIWSNSYSNLIKFNSLLLIKSSIFASLFLNLYVSALVELKINIKKIIKLFFISIN